MHFNLRISKRYAVLQHALIIYLLASTVLRICLLAWQYREIELAPLSLVRTIFTGLFFDIGTVSYFLLPATLYIAVSNKIAGTLFDKVVIFVSTYLFFLILAFTFFAEITFWEEFRSRFNFIAVDYLIYTHEVIANINESYPLPFLIGSVVGISLLIMVFLYRRKSFKNTFRGKAGHYEKIFLAGLTAIVVFIYSYYFTNTGAEWSANRYNSEISKNGIYSFFAAFRNNQMKYQEFYTSIDNDKAFQTVRNKLLIGNSGLNANTSIRREITTDGEPKKYNVVFVLVESLSASFMKEFGNTENITPFLDSLAQKSIFFENMYATGNRTVRGMEAVTLCIPPTPGQSIVKRPDNAGLFTINTIFKGKGYQSNFFYGGDGYFDNMNAYFGGNGFDIFDRGRGSILSDKIKTTRTLISDNEVTFENAWGICDEDIYNKVLSASDRNFKDGKPFFDFIMTTSNHRPYSYPANKIDIPSGTGRPGAVKYTDFALRSFLQKAKSKPWFKNTIFVVVADHCASTAGKNEIDVANYHIPAFIFNVPEAVPQKVGKQCSQIDLMPTVLGLMHWDYESNLFGQDIFNKDYEEKALIATYRKLALMKGDNVVILSDQKKQAAYTWQKQGNILNPAPMDQSFLEETISWYQTADYLFNHKLLK